MDRTVKIVIFVIAMLLLLFFSPPFFIIILAFLLKNAKFRQFLMRDPQPPQSALSPESKPSPEPFSSEPEPPQGPSPASTSLKDEAVAFLEAFNSPAKEDAYKEKYYKAKERGEEVYPWEMPPEKLPWE